MEAEVILTCRLGEIAGGEILPAMNGEMIRHSFTLKHGEWDFYPCLMVKITPFCLHSGYATGWMDGSH
jgi:hypothetical protein